MRSHTTVQTERESFQSEESFTAWLSHLTIFFAILKIHQFSGRFGGFVALERRLDPMMQRFDSRKESKLTCERSMLMQTRGLISLLKDILSHW